MNTNFLIKIALLLIPVVGIGQVKSIEYFPESVSTEHQIFFLGETHGIHSNFIHSMTMVEELKSKNDFKFILAEMSFSAGLLLNNSIQQKDTVALKKVLIGFGETFYRTDEKYRFYKNIIRLNEKYETKIEVLGVDIPASARHFCDSVLKTSKDTFVVEYVQNNLKQAERAFKASDSDWDKTRDPMIFENFKKLQKHYNLNAHKAIGFWGTSHINKSKSEGVEWFASNLVKDGVKVYSIAQYYINSSVMKPWFWVKNEPEGKCFYFQDDYSNIRGKSKKTLLEKPLELIFIPNLLLSDLKTKKLF